MNGKTFQHAHVWKLNRWYIKKNHLHAYINIYLTFSKLFHWKESFQELILSFFFLELILIEREDTLRKIVKIYSKLSSRRAFEIIPCNSRLDRFKSSKQIR